MASNRGSRPNNDGYALLNKHSLQKTYGETFGSYCVHCYPALTRLHSVAAEQFLQYEVVLQKETVMYKVEAL